MCEYSSNELAEAIKVSPLTKCVAFCISLGEEEGQSLFPLKLNVSWPLAEDAELWALEVYAGLYDERTLLCRVDLYGNVEFMQPDCEARVIQVLIAGLNSMREHLETVQRERDGLVYLWDECQERLLEARADGDS